MMTVATWRSSSLELLRKSNPPGLYGRMFPACCHRAEDGTLAPSSEGWLNAGMGAPTEFLTLSTSQSPSAAVESSLSDILETGDVPQRYFLSAIACQGILGRAKKRGKTLPPVLAAALEAAAGVPTPTG